LHYLKLPLLPRPWTIFVVGHVLVLGAAWGAADLVVEAHGGYMSATGSHLRLVPMRPVSPSEAVNSKSNAQTTGCRRVQVESSFDQDAS
jgi:hypothetical protein